MEQFFINLRWIPALVMLAFKNRVGVRRKKDGIFLYVDATETEVEHGYNNLIRIKMGATR